MNEIGASSEESLDLSPWQGHEQLMAPSAQDRTVKRARVLSILAERGADSVLLTSAPAVNWYLDGIRTHVNLSASPIVAVEVGTAGDRIHITANEAARLMAEELPFGSSVQIREWWEPLVWHGLSEATVSTELRMARSHLLPAERHRFARLGADAAVALTDALSIVVPRMTELELAARVTSTLTAGGMEPLVVLVGGYSRRSYRHPLPTEASIGRRAMVVVCARRWGLIASLTRWVCFGELTEEEADADARVLEVEADAFAATRPGASLESVLDAIAASYPNHGFVTNEWTGHHQGGLAGYDGRDPRAVRGLPDVVPPVAWVAWNPTGGGAKVEDTVMIENANVVPITVDPRWPITQVRGVARPSVLQL